MLVAAFEADEAELGRIDRDRVLVAERRHCQYQSVIIIWRRGPNIERARDVEDLPSGLQTVEHAFR